ncbi:MAG: S-layer homology domain-containing protein [Butyricicoccus sp.]|nr:S-layer homology domain-containing protein [Butyricicoccus sp.]
MKQKHGFHWKKKACSVLLAGSLLCSSMPAYAVFSSDSVVAAAQTLRAAGPGEYLYTQLTAEERAVYNSIVDQIEKLAQNDQDPSGVQVTIPKGSTYSINGRPIFAVFRDHPEFFWVDSSNLVWAEGIPKTDDEGNSVWVLSRKYPDRPFFYAGFTPQNLQGYRNQLEAKVREIQSGMPENAKDTVSKLKYLNDWIALHNVYNANGVGASNFSRCAASGLLSDNNTATTDDDPVCYGYATAMKVLLDACGIENVYIEGWARNGKNGSGEQHAWNYVKLDDGTGQTKWYALDPTWDDPSASSLPAQQLYFLVGSNTITAKNLTGYEAFGKNHDPSQSPAYTSYHFTYPTLAADSRNPSADGNVSLEKPGSPAKTYDTLEAAMQDAASGDTLVLQNAVSLSSTLTLKDGVTLDLNGQTGGNSLFPQAIASTAVPVLRIEADSSASIINSGAFTAIESTANDSKVVENLGSLTLGGNVQFKSSTAPIGGGSILSGNPPRKAPHVRYFASGTSATTFLVAEPTPPAKGSFSAQSGNTVQDLQTAFPEPTVSVQYYGSTGSPAPVPAGEYSLQWTLKQSPNGSRIQPTDPLENGTYRFEAQAFDYTIPYEVEVSGLTAAPQEVTSVALTDLTAPVAGQALDTTASTNTAGVTLSPVTWEPSTSSTAAYNTVYTAVLTLTASSGYTFAPSVAVTVNGRPAQVSTQSNGTLSVRFAFPATQAQTVRLQSIPTPSSIRAANGTALKDLPLPAQVDIVTTDSRINKANVSWTRVPVDGTKYDPSKKTAQTFRLQGTVTLPGGVEANGVSLTVKIDVTVAAAAIAQTAAPTAQPAPGRYTSNQSVKLTSSTAGATIYYTLDGSTPSVAKGIRYKTPIALTGTKGKSVKTQIKAIAVSSGRTDSVVVTLDYVIALPSSSSSNSSGNSSSSNKTQTTTRPDGSTITTVTKPNGSSTQTTKYADGSQKVVETQKDGTTTTTTTDKNGGKTEVLKKPDGTSQTTIKNPNGASSVTLTSKNGRVSSEATLPSGVIADATKKGNAVSLPMPTLSVTSKAQAPTVTVKLPTGTATRVEIPVKNPTTDTVAVLLKANGAQEVIKTTVATQNGLSVTLRNGETVQIIDNHKNFSDVPTSYWGADSVRFVTSRELFSGTGATTFAPEASMNRAMIVTVLARLEGVEPAANKVWYEAGRQWAMANGISDGTNMTGNVTREQLASMLYRYAGSPAVRGTLGGFADAAHVHSYAQQAMTWAVENGLISGVTSTTLNPQGQATRGQVSAILQRFIQSRT